MWVPKNEGEIIAACTSNSLEETVTFDAKREVPVKNVETAKDVSAMANTSGGVLIYGIAEDENGFPNVLTPILLEGQRERIDSILRTSIEEVPGFTISAIRSEGDASRGYLVIVVPPSERAPHMVVVKGEQRYYGRSETGNYPLNQSDVARLYERRKISESGILPVLEEQIVNSPFDHDGHAHLHILIKPVLHDDGLLEKAGFGEQNHQQLLNTVLSTVLHSGIYAKYYFPDFLIKNWIRRPEGYLNKMEETIPGNHDMGTLFLQANFDGSGNLFCSRAAETHGEEGNLVKWFIADVVAGNTTKFLAFFSEMYKRASYAGMVDVGIGLTGLENSVDSAIQRYVLLRTYHYDKPDYRRIKRVSATQLQENPRGVASELVMPLIDAISQGRTNPFANNN